MLRTRSEEQASAKVDPMSLESIKNDLRPALARLAVVLLYVSGAAICLAIPAFATKAPALVPFAIAVSIALSTMLAAVALSKPVTARRVACVSTQRRRC